MNEKLGINKQLWSSVRQLPVIACGHRAAGTSVCHPKLGQAGSQLARTRSSGMKFCAGTKESSSLCFGSKFNRKWSVSHAGREWAEKLTRFKKKRNSELLAVLSLRKEALMLSLPWKKIQFLSRSVPRRARVYMTLKTSPEKKDFNKFEAFSKKRRQLRSVSVEKLWICSEWFVS